MDLPDLEKDKGKYLSMRKEYDKTHAEINANEYVLVALDKQRILLEKIMKRLSEDRKRLFDKAQDLAEQMEGYEIAMLDSVGL